MAVITSTAPATINAAAQYGSTVARASIAAVSSQPRPNSPNTAAPANRPAPTPTDLPFSAICACSSCSSSRSSLDRESVSLPTNAPIEGSASRGVLPFVSLTVSHLSLTSLCMPAPGPPTPAMPLPNRATGRSATRSLRRHPVAHYLTSNTNTRLVSQCHHSWSLVTIADGRCPSCE